MSHRDDPRTETHDIHRAEPAIGMGFLAEGGDPGVIPDPSDVEPCVVPEPADPDAQPKSTHRVEVVRVREILEHPNADNLVIIPVFDYVVLGRREDWAVGDLGAYIVPDSLVPIDRPEFAFLSARCKEGATHHRVRVQKLRGIVSQGLLIPAPDGAEEGENLASVLDVVRYEPVMLKDSRVSVSGPCEPPPPGDRPVYDIDAFQRYAHLLEEGEPIVVTEKIHGCNARYTYDGQADKFFCGSRRQWKVEAENDVWWLAFNVHPTLARFLVMNPGHTVYGEVYGAVQDLRYGLAPGQVAFKAFDILGPTGWVPTREAREMARLWELPWVPVLYEGVYDKELVIGLAEGMTTLMPSEDASTRGEVPHVREGVVVLPLRERWDPRLGRVQLKAVGNGYLSK